jgi:hypothetical protein
MKVIGREVGFFGQPIQIEPIVQMLSQIGDDVLDSFAVRLSRDDFHSTLQYALL